MFQVGGEESCALLLYIYGSSGKLAVSTWGVSPLGSGGLTNSRARLLEEEVGGASEGVMPGEG